LLVGPGNVTNVFHINLFLSDKIFFRCGTYCTSLSPCYSQLSFFNHYRSMF